MQRSRRGLKGNACSPGPFLLADPPRTPISRSHAAWGASQGVIRAKGQAAQGGAGRSAPTSRCSRARGAWAVSRLTPGFGDPRALPAGWERADTRARTHTHTRAHARSRGQRRSRKEPRSESEQPLVKETDMHRQPGNCCACGELGTPGRRAPGGRARARRPPAGCH